MSRRSRAALLSAVTLCVFLLGFGVVWYQVGRLYEVRGDSMSPLLRGGERIFATTVGANDVAPGMVVVVRDPAGGPSLVKRVVALGGAVVEAHDGYLWVDGAQLVEAYLPRDVKTPPFDPVVVPMGYLFVLGDNRPASTDSRIWGPVPAGTVLGRPRLVLFPHVGALR